MKLMEVWIMASLEVGQEIQVYKNLNTGSWSVKHKTAKGWRLEGHYNALQVSHCVPKTSVKGAARIVSKGSREVVAWIQCRFVGLEVDLEGSEVHYNPDRSPDFHYNSGEIFTGCEFASFLENSPHFMENY